jgi:hypothetical protein
MMFGYPVIKSWLAAEGNFQAIQTAWQINRWRGADLSGRIRTCGQDKLTAHPIGKERVDGGFEDHWIDNSSMADCDPTLTVDKNSQTHFSQIAWINKRPTTSITAQVTP